MTTLSTLQSLVAQGESETLELKRSSAELRRAGETLSGMGTSCSAFTTRRVAYARSARS